MGGRPYGLGEVAEISIYRSALILPSVRANACPLWAIFHILDPKPSLQEKKLLAGYTGKTVKQVRNHAAASLVPCPATRSRSRILTAGIHLPCRSLTGSLTGGPGGYSIALGTGCFITVFRRIFQSLESKLHFMHPTVSDSGRHGPPLPPLPSPLSLTGVGGRE